MIEHTTADSTRYRLLRAADDESPSEAADLYMVFRCMEDYGFTHVTMLAVLKTADVTEEIEKWHSAETTRIASALDQ